jgi:RND superfamily putative drug exporter
MALLGDKAWWIPRWLDRLLPTFDVEGEGVAKELRLAPWPGERADGRSDAVVVHGLTVAGPRGPGLGEPPVVGPVSVRVPDGGTLVVHGDAAAPVSAFLLAVAGRLPVDEGAAKVAGLVLPERASTVRSRVGFVDAEAEQGAPAGAVTAAVRDGATIVVVDRADLVTDRADRQGLATAFAGAHATGATIVVGSTGVSATDLLPEGTPVLDVAAGWGAPSRLVGGEVPPPPPDDAHDAHDVTEATGDPSSQSPSENPDSTPAEVRA